VHRAVEVILAGFIMLAVAGWCVYSDDSCRVLTELREKHKQYEVS